MGGVLDLALGAVVVVAANEARGLPKDSRGLSRLNMPDGVR
jgi:hypothetical protein